MEGFDSYIIEVYEIATQKKLIKNVEDLNWVVYSKQFRLAQKYIYLLDELSCSYLPFQRE